MPVTGGNGEVSNFYGILDLGGSLNVVNAATGKTVAITGLELNFFTGALTGIFPGGPAHHPGLPQRRHVREQQRRAARHRDLQLRRARPVPQGRHGPQHRPGHQGLHEGHQLGAFTTTFDVTVS